MQLKKCKLISSVLSRSRKVGKKKREKREREKNKEQQAIVHPSCYNRLVACLLFSFFSIQPATAAHSLPWSPAL